MRYRKKHGIMEKLYGFKDSFIEDFKENKDNWNDIFGNNNPIHIEIGSGRGKFITTLASKNPNINYIAIEKLDGLVFEINEKISNMELENIKTICGNVDDIELIFGKNEINRLYINFCDPWPKKRHAKRRLTHKNYLKKYINILDDKTQIEFKTDNTDLFEFSLNEFNEFGFRLKNIHLNLHKDEELSSEIVTTEYEEKFKNIGKNIYKLKAYNWNMPM